MAVEVPGVFGAFAVEGLEGEGEVAGGFLGGDGSPTAAEAKMRHMLGYAYATTDQPSAAIREYRRVLATPGLDPAISTRVTAAIAALDQSD